MKKLLALTALATIMFAAPNAYADDHGGKHHKGPKGGMFEKLDLDNNGEITREEFMSLHETRFTQMDSDNNGSITEDEAKAAKEKWKEKMKERREKMKEKRGVKEAE